jgi:hypothetical protein
MAGNIIRVTSEFLTEDENFRVSVDGNLEAEDKILVFCADVPAFIEWLSAEYAKTTGNIDG